MTIGVTPNMMNDLSEFWQKYCEENNLDISRFKIVLIDIDSSLQQTLGKVMNMIIDEVLERERRDLDE